jgi:THO complex subunit 1
LKDNGYAARFIFLAPPDISELERRLRRRGSDDEETIRKRLEIAQRELEHSKAEGFYDKIFVNDDIETTYKQLESYIFGIEENNQEPSQLISGEEKEKSAEVTSTEVEMVNGEPTAEDSSKIDGSGADDAKIAADETVTASESLAAEKEMS